MKLYSGCSGGLARLAQVPPLVAIVLLIDSVLPQHVDGLVAEVVGAVGQLLDNAPRRPWLCSLIVSTRLRCGDVVVMAVGIGNRRICGAHGLRRCSREALAAQCHPTPVPPDIESSYLISLPCGGGEGEM